MVIIMLRRVLVPNYEFIKNMDGDLFDEFINLEDDLPNYICRYVRKVFPNLNSLRIKAEINNPNLENFDTTERAISRKMDLIESQEFKIQFALDFLEKYPQFRGIIKSVKYYDDAEGKDIFIKELNLI